MDHACVCFERYHDVGRLQEESSATAAAPTAAPRVTYGLA
jgi:hypothetical protein